MIRFTRIAWGFLGGACFLGAFAGCPDRSMLRSPPDNSKQSDNLTVNEEINDRAEAEAVEKAIPATPESSNSGK